MKIGINKTASIKWLLLPIIVIMASGCGKSDEIKIGFAGTLSGKNSDFGIQGRNGVIYAVEEINRHGGINGRLVKLLMSDDKNNPADAIKGDQELIDKGVVAIIGHMTSAMTIAVIDIINKNKIVLISPTTSTDLLSGKDDFFFRVMGTVKIEAENLAELSFQKYQNKNAAFVFDISNKAYTESWIQYFKSRHLAMGGTVTASTPFDSTNKLSFSKIVEETLNDKTDVVCIVASSGDTALICQQIRKRRPSVNIVASGWALTKDILFHGGEAVEGVIFSQRYSPEIKKPEFKKFKNTFRDRFKTEPGFAPVFSYNAAQVLFDALKRNDNPAELKKTILSKRTYEGIDKRITIDKFGDATTRHYIMTIKNQKFVELD